MITNSGSWISKTENRKQKTENRKQKTENRKQKTENRKQKTENIRLFDTHPFGAEEATFLFSYCIHVY